MVATIEDDKDEEMGGEVTEEHDEDRAKESFDQNDIDVEKAPEQAETSEAKKKSASTSSKNRDRGVSLPLSRIKQIMKMDPQVQMASNESVYLIAKSAEEFVKMLSKEALSYTQSSKKKTIQKRDVDSAISNSEQLSFLDGALE